VVIDFEGGRQYGPMTINLVQIGLMDTKLTSKALLHY